MNIDDKIQASFNDLFSDPAPEEPPQQASPGRKLARSEVYKEYQQNILASGTLRAEITKGAKAGEDPETLLLKAVKAISLMTGDKLFYEQIKTEIEKKK